MRDKLKDLEKEANLELGKSFRKLIGCRCDVATRYWGQENRLFKRIGLITMVTFDTLYLDCDGVLRAIPLKEIVEIKEVPYEAGR